MKDETSWPVIAAIGLGFVLLVGGAWFGAAWLLMWAWNVFVPAAFSGPELTYWQAFGAMVLVWIVGAAFRSMQKTKD